MYGADMSGVLGGACTGADMSGVLGGACTGLTCEVSEAHGDGTYIKQIRNPPVGMYVRSNLRGV